MIFCHWIKFTTKFKPLSVWLLSLNSGCHVAVSLWNTGWAGDVLAAQGGPEAMWGWPPVRNLTYNHGISWGGAWYCPVLWWGDNLKAVTSSFFSLKFSPFVYIPHEKGAIEAEKIDCRWDQIQYNNYTSITK